MTPLSHSRHLSQDGAGEGILAVATVDGLVHNERRAGLEGVRIGATSQIFHTFERHRIDAARDRARASARKVPGSSGVGVHQRTGAVATDELRALGDRGQAVIDRETDVVAVLFDPHGGGNVDECLGGEHPRRIRVDSDERISNLVQP